LGKSFQENSAVAFVVYLVGSAGVTPDLHHYGTSLPLLLSTALRAVRRFTASAVAERVLSVYERVAQPGRR